MMDYEFFKPHDESEIAAAMIEGSTSSRNVV
jgi:hypothetical protein